MFVLDMNFQLILKIKYNGKKINLGRNLKP